MKSVKKEALVLAEFAGWNLKTPLVQQRLRRVEQYLSEKPSVANALKYYMHLRGMSNSDVATAIGVHSGYISQIRTGASSPSTDTIVDICKALKVSPAAFFLRAELPRTKSVRKVLTKLEK